MWPKIFEVKETGAPFTFDLIDDVAHKRLMVYLCQNDNAWEMGKGDYEINGRYITMKSPIVKSGDKIWVHDFYRKQIEKLNGEEEELAIGLLHHVATYLLANQIASCLQRSNTNIGDAYIISYLIRNAFAHDPFMPQWKIKDKDKNKLFCVSGIIKLDTNNLHGKGVVWHDFGSPLALLRLSEYVRQKLSA